MLGASKEGSMSAKENANLVRRYFEDCVSRASGPDQQRALSSLDDLVTEDFVMYFSADADAEAARGRERHKEFLVGHARHYPDDHWTLEALIADDDTVACRWHFQSIHAMTGNPIDVRAADFFSVREGRLAELRRFLDFESLHRQAQPLAAPG